MNCEKCNTSLEYGEKVCPNCGHRAKTSSRSVSDSVSSGVAALMTSIRTIIFLYAVFMAIFASKGQYAGVVWTVIFIGFAEVVLAWLAVIFSSESKGWAMLLLLLGLLAILTGFTRGSLIILVTGIVYLVYALKCIGD